MRIPRELMQFRGVPTLFIVCGTQEAVCYRAADGVIVEVARFRLPRVRFTDREGHVVRRGGGAAVVSAMVREPTKQDRQREFLRELRACVGRAMAEWTPQLCEVFAPGPILPAVIRTLPRALQQKIAHRIRGNHCEAHPHELVRMTTSSS